MLDFHLSELYGIPTRVLKQAVKRNKDRFPEDFLFELTDVEINHLVSQIVIPSKSYLGGAVPFAFTETGVAMLSSVLKSAQAIKINISIMRTFVLLRKALYKNHNQLLWRSEIEQKISKQDEQILSIFEYLRRFEKEKQKELLQKTRRKIGYKTMDFI